jgi:hypothetical protein
MFFYCNFFLQICEPNIPGVARQQRRQRVRAVVLLLLLLLVVVDTWKRTRE